jgi:hypothetical protein
MDLEMTSIIPIRRRGITRLQRKWNSLRKGQSQRRRLRSPVIGSMAIVKRSLWAFAELGVVGAAVHVLFAVHIALALGVFVILATLAGTTVSAAATIFRTIRRCLTGFALAITTHWLASAVLGAIGGGLRGRLALAITAHWLASAVLGAIGGRLAGITLAIAARWIAAAAGTLALQARAQGGVFRSASALRALLPAL